MRVRVRWHTVLLLLLALGAILGHVCVLPGHVHAAAHRADHDDASPSSGDDALHAASCDMLRPASPAPAVTAAPTRLAAVVPVPIRSAVVATHVSEPSTSPPLYLVHGALLI